MDTATKILYFILAIVLLASIGVTIPFLLDWKSESADLIKNLNQNLITYYIAIFVTSSLDIVIKSFDDNKPESKPKFLAITILNLIVLVGSGFMISWNTNKFSYLVLIGVILSYTIWWFCNYDNPNLNASSSMGGNPEKALKDAK